MLTTIEFNNQTRFYAGEIGDVRRNRELAAEAPSESIPTQLSPWRLLGIRHIPAQDSGAIARRGAAAQVQAIGPQIPPP